MWSNSAFAALISPKPSQPSTAVKYMLSGGCSGLMCSFISRFSRLAVFQIALEALRMSPKCFSQGLKPLTQQPQFATSSDSEKSRAAAKVFMDEN
jgi:hypothetical protein